MKNHFFAISLLLFLTIFSQSLWAQSSNLLVVNGDNYSTVVTGGSGNNSGSGYNAWDDGHIRLGGTQGDGIFHFGDKSYPCWNWDDKYVIVHIDCVPYSISCYVGVNNGAATMRNCYVSESADGTSWTEVWSEDFSSETSCVDQPLSATTRYLKLCYAGNYSGYFRDVTITKKDPALTATESTLNFGQVKYTESVSRSFKINYVNLTSPISLTTNDADFSVTPSSIDNINCKEVSDQEVIVVFSPTTMGLHNGKKLTVQDAAGHKVELTLNAEGIKNDQTITWMTTPYVQIPGSLAAPIATAPSGNVTLSILDESDNEYTEYGGLRVDAGSLVTTVSAVENAEVRVRATAAAGTFYNAASDTRVFTLTAKTPQYIDIAEDVITLVVGNTYTLNAVSKDFYTNAATSLPVQYSNPDNTSIATLLGTTITAKSVGHTSLTISCAGNSTYAAAETKSVTIIVFAKQVCAQVNTMTDKALSKNPTNITCSNGEPFSSVSFKVQNTTGDWFGGSRSTTLTVKDAGGSTLQFKVGSGAYESSHTFSQGKNSTSSLYTITVNGRAKTLTFSKEGDIKIKEINASQCSYLDNPGNKTTSVQSNKSTDYNFSFNYSSYEYIVVSNTSEYVKISKGDTRYSIDANGVLTFDDACYNFGTHTVTLTIDCPLPASSQIVDHIIIRKADGSTPVEFDITINITQGEEFHFTTEGTWETPSNWKVGGVKQTRLPSVGNKVFIEAPCRLRTEKSVSGLAMNGGTLTITPAGGLSVGTQGVTGTSTSNMALQSDGINGTGYLRVNPASSNKTINASVQMYCKAYYDLSSGYGNDAPWQYFGCPVTTSPNLQELFSGAWIYGWDEPTGAWVAKTNSDQLVPFTGYALTQPDNADGKIYTFAGQLVTPANKTLNTSSTPKLSYTNASAYKGWNQLANSFVAPIDVTKLTAADFTNCDATIYIYNTGTHAQWTGYSVAGSGTNAGQYVALPVNSVAQMGSLSLRVVPAMQGFFVQATGASPVVNINYASAIWGGDYASYPNQPMRAPRRAKKSLDDDEQALMDSLGLTARVEMSVVGDGRQDNLYLLQADNYTTSYDNGCDAQKMFGEDNLPAIYTNEVDGQMAVCATNNLVGTYIGFKAPKMDKDTVLTYTLNFFNTLGGRFVLTDLVANQDVLMTEGGSYTFQVNAGVQNDIRFIVKESHASETPTSVDAISATNHMMQCGSVLYASDATGAQQMISIYDMQGKLIDTHVFVGSTSYNLSTLPQGVYLARMADQTLKIVY